MDLAPSEKPLRRSRVAQNHLSSLGSAAKCVGLHFNESKTEYINKTGDLITNLKTLSGYILKCKEDYNYLGSFISSSEKDFNFRKGMA